MAEKEALASSVEVSVKSQHGETNVRVVARFRPPVTDEEEKDQAAFVVRGKSSALGVTENATVQSQDGRWSFEFDTCFSEEASQDVIYGRIGAPAVQDVLAGYNGTILMYGQTGSGKTFSLFGSFTEPRLRGLAPRAAEQLVQECLICKDVESTIHCSFLEIYKERMRDLLHPSNQSLRIKEIPQRGLMVDGLTLDDITDSGDVLKALDTGNAWRSVAATRQNQYSSRSHAIFTLYVSRRSLNNAREHTGKLSLVDLAGSERVSRSHCVGETLEEAKKINASLTALGKVIDALSERRGHVPYRDSTLTRVLEEALGGNSHTTLLTTASACSQYLDETLCSLRFAARAQKALAVATRQAVGEVRNCAHVNFVYSAEELWPLVAQLQKDLAAARRELNSNKSLLLVPRRRCRSTSITSEEVTTAPDASWSSTTMSRFSTLSGETPRSESSPSAPSDLREEEVVPPAHSNAEALAVALETVKQLEAALLAQEEALEAAILLRAEDPSKEKICFEDAWPQRWRQLRSQVTLHALRWRLQRERFRCQSQQQEAEIRSRHRADLQRQLEAAHAELSLLKSSGEVSPRRRPMAKSRLTKMQSTPALLEASVGGDQLRALREAQCALRGENLELKQELTLKDQQIAGLTAELAALKLQVAAKGHEANVKDAMLSCLQKEAWQAAEQCDEELEQLLSSVATPLLGAFRSPGAQGFSMCVLPGMPVVSRV